MPPSNNSVVTTAKDFFLHLASIVALYLSTWAILSLLFEIINFRFPDRLTSYIDPYSTLIRIAIAMLIVVFPIYLLLTRYLRRDIERVPAKRDLPIRKLLVYLTIFLAAALMVGDLVALINNFLGGEISARFILKVVAMFLVAGTIFSYYGLDLRRKDGLSAKVAKNFAAGATGFIVASIVGGFLVMGSPFTIRQAKFDQTRVNNLQEIQYQVLNYWQQKRVLPDNLDQVNNPVGNFAVPLDPDTRAAYEYTVLSDISFRLCAVFGTKSVNDGSSQMEKTPVAIKGQENWQHPAGKFCFDRTIDPGLYPEPKTVPAVPAN